MKILQINAVYEYSSTGRTTKELHQYLISQGVDSYVAAVNVSGKDPHIIKIGNHFVSKLHSFLSRFLGRQGFYSYFATKILLKRVDQISPDVVHLRNLHGNYINLPLLLKYLAEKRIPTVITLHDFWFMTGHCCYFIDSKCDKWKEKCGHCPDQHKWIPSWFFDKSAENLTAKKSLFGAIPKLAVIGVSDWVTNFVYDSILKDSFIIKRIYNWVDTNTFKPVPTEDLRLRLNLKGEFIILGVAQTWSVQKGLNDFIEIAKLCSECKIVLVGNTSYIPKDIPDNILCVGVTNNVQDLVSYYSMADVFFNPTKRETFGKVTVEALSCGTPVVAYNVTATPELIRQGCGYVVDEGDLHSVVECIHKINSTGKLSYTQHCRNFVSEEFSKEVLMAEYYKLYQTLISEKIQ